MKIVLCDTNILYWLFRRWSNHLSIDQCELIDIAQLNEIWISDFIVDELVTTLRRNEWIFATPEMIYWFRQYIWLYLHLSRSPVEQNKKYIFDEYDIQILQDAIDINADILLTHNLKDFDIQAIREVFQIQVTDRLSQSVFEQ